MSQLLIRLNRVAGFRTLIAAALAVLLVATSTPARAETVRYVPGEIIVKLKGKSKSLKSQAFIGKAVSEKAMSLKGSWAGLNMHHFSLKAGQNLDATIAELRKDPDVEYAERNYYVNRQSTGLEGKAVAMSEVRASGTSGGYTTFSQTSAPIQLSDAWSAETTGLDAPIVAVIDTGIDFTHDIFVDSGAIWTNTKEIPNNGIDDDGNGYIDDVHGWNFVSNTNDPSDDEGHGTHVSGIVLGTTQDILASPIDAAKIRIMPLKFLDSTGSGTTSDAVKAIYYAVNNGAKVLSNSWGGGGFSNALLDAIAYAYDHKVVFVAAAGNASSNNDASPTYPANYEVPNVISIAATSDADGLASFSNFGAQTVHMGSPGVSIWSSLPGNMYGRASGTSMATPFVSGVAAMMVRESSGLSGYEVKSLIFEGAEEVASLETKTTTKSRLNAYNAITRAKSTAATGSQPGFNAASERSPASEGGDAQMGGCGLVVKALHDGSAGGDGGGLSGPQKNVAFFAILIILASPVLLSIALRNRAGKNQRRYTRYQIDSSVRVKFGDRELVGQVSTISLGGLQLNTEEWLEKGGIVKMSIASPDGKDEVQVEGKIVWSEEQKRYGVAFANADDSVISSISRWTQSLLKA